MSNIAARHLSESVQPLRIPTCRRLRASYFYSMDYRALLPAFANYFVIAGLVLYGYKLFAEYHERGKWAKNMTGLLAGLGMFTLATALLLTPDNVEILAFIARAKVSTPLVYLSSFFLLAAITAFGVITYLKPIRLWHERKIHRDLNRGLPRIP